MFDSSRVQLRHLPAPSLPIVEFTALEGQKMVGRDPVEAVLRCALCRLEVWVRVRAAEMPHTACFGAILFWIEPRPAFGCSMNMSSRCASHGWTVHFVIKSIMSAKNLAGLPDWLAKLCAVVPCKVLNVSAEDAACMGMALALKNTDSVTPWSHVQIARCFTDRKMKLQARPFNYLETLKSHKS